MSQTHHQQQLADLFRRTKTAHLEAFSETEGADPEWPLWYARHTAGDLNSLMHTELTVSELTSFFVAAERARQSQESGVDWPEFYAQFFFNEFAV